ncbi:uncharacterized protein LOC135483003 [Lineus longissimus]|uniref:uncharacterized protein LOC135483003 n=1 Tax=Lineus longissimus TaxID=88925 RepID=UPI00315CC739
MFWIIVRVLRGLVLLTGVASIDYQRYRDQIFEARCKAWCLQEYGKLRTGSPENGEIDIMMCDRNICQNCFRGCLNLGCNNCTRDLPGCQVGCTNIQSLYEHGNTSELSVLKRTIQPAAVYCRKANKTMVSWAATSLERKIHLNTTAAVSLAYLIFYKKRNTQGWTLKTGKKQKGFL